MRRRGLTLFDFLLGLLLLERRHRRLDFLDLGQAVREDARGQFAPETTEVRKAAFLVFTLSIVIRQNCGE